MKKSMIIGLSLTILGGIMFALAIGHTGFKTIVWDNGFKVEDEHARATKMVSKDLKGSVNQIDFRTESAVDIQSGDVKKPTISYPKFNTVKQHGKTLTITGEQQHRTRIIGFSIESYNNGGGRIIITIPKKHHLDGISGRNYNGISIKNLNVNNVKLMGEADISLENVKSRSGLTLKNTDDTSMKNVTAPGITQTSDGGDLTYQNADFSDGATTISTDGGDVSFASTKLKDTMINSDGGDITLNHNNVTGSIIATTDGGDIDAIIPNRKKVQVNASADGGDISIFGHDNHSWQMSKQNLALYRLSSDGGDVTVR